MTRLALLFTAIIVSAVTYLVIRELSGDSRKMGLRAYEPESDERWLGI